MYSLFHCVEINDMKELREKGHYDVRMTLIKTECLVFKVDVLLPAYKSTKVPEMYQIIQEVRLVVRDSYQVQPPNLFFLSDVFMQILRTCLKLASNPSETTSPRY